LGGDLAGSSAHAPKYQADRELTEQELKELLSLTDFLIDKQKDPFDRRQAALRLGAKFRHKYATPALLAVLRDENDHVAVRQRCVMTLGRTADRRVIDYLIEALLDREMNVWIEAHRKLELLTGPQEVQLGRFGPKSDSERHKRVHKWWRDWWEAHRDDFPITWNEA
jgi:HEAT repeat protein